MSTIRKGDDHDLAAEAHLDLENMPGNHVETTEEFAEEQRSLLRAGKISKTLTLILVSTVPISLSSAPTLTPQLDTCPPHPLAHAHVRLGLHL